MRPGILVAVVVGVLLAETDLGACGDKFLIVGRGTRFQHGPAAPRQVSVVIYAPSASSLGDRPRVLSVEKALTRGGYSCATAASSEDLSGILRSRIPGIVLADIAEARAVERRIEAASSGAIVLPFLPDASHRAVVEARKTWGDAVKSSASPESVRDSVDAAVERLVKSRGRSGP
jgi:hypothetical protein